MVVTPLLLRIEVLLLLLLLLMMVWWWWVVRLRIVASVFTVASIVVATYHAKHEEKDRRFDLRTDTYSCNCDWVVDRKNAGRTTIEEVNGRCHLVLDLRYRIDSCDSFDCSCASGQRWMDCRDR